MEKVNRFSVGLVEVAKVYAENLPFGSSAVMYADDAQAWIDRKDYRRAAQAALDSLRYTLGERSDLFKLYAREVAERADLRSEARA